MSLKAAVNVINLCQLKGVSILEQLKMEEALLRAGTGNWCLVNEGASPAIVIGISGKTEELIRRLRRAQIAKQRVAVFKPRIDNRYSSEHIVSHSEQSLVSQVVDDASEILAASQDAQVVGIDEAQFFKANLVDVCEKLANEGKRVIVAGLDQDYRGKPF